MTVSDLCPLCQAEPYRFAERDQRLYLRCPSCDLVFVPPSFHLARAQEEARYREHNNDIADPRYRAFLRKLHGELAPLLPAGASGLDYGCGPGPALAALFAESGHPTSVYDPIFFPEETSLARTYDFVVCTETAEHFFEPKRELDRLDKLVRTGGWLGIMTQMLEDWTGFATWYYPRDPTHVCFYSARTMAWIGASRGWEYRQPRVDVALFRKP
jgi:hypothetical protein